MLCVYYFLQKRKKHSGRSNIYIHNASFLFRDLFFDPSMKDENFPPILSSFIKMMRLFFYGVDKEIDCSCLRSNGASKVVDDSR